MVKGKMKFRWVGILIIIFLISTYCIGAQVFAKLSKDESKSRADVITIDTLKVFGYLEKPEVTFLHDVHTDALEKQGKDCLACHLPKSNSIPGVFKEAVAGIDPLSPKFKRLEDTARKEVMDIYHKFCIDCHNDMGAQKLETGPVTCGECHKESKTVSSRQPAGMDKNLHFRHSKAREKKCEQCHHEFNEEKKELVYVKEKEGSCRYCHLENPKEIPVYAKDSAQISKLSMKEASHLDCISCHRKTIAKEMDAGPVKCSGCHDAEMQAKFKKAETIERMERKQPDVVLVSTGDKLPDDGRLGNVRMNAVAYNHKSHEESNDTCRVCHHASLDKCSKCHTLSGSKDGDYVKLEKAFHQIGTDKSCLGCHELNQQDPKCSGCHVFMEKGRKQADESCLKCHENLTPDMMNLVKSGDNTALAEKMMKARSTASETYPDDDIPEKVVIKDMMDKYQAAELPHRKIVNTLMKNISDNKMAGYFHRDKGTICQGCHHNSPVSTKPPKCSSCHGKPFDENELLRPGLMGAYHQQCMTCHKEMKLEKPAGCTGCHKEK
ncbi:High-molecular-weight cytochrome c [Desulfonema limicola]|uniref:High-molecular-weight cytochrome c n=1 Tax=Desulfonema limicola TaxID=45656 RepID=A0A975GJE5_9BACT|nr:cytochrome c3 family protein [Desulfonema limicola]QTA83636.1 High-molecular-weight cytochrome c [Desulfonema limicola]